MLVFEDTSRWIWPLGPVVDKDKIIAKIDTIEAEGETNMYPPLEQAYLALYESFADVKHIIVSTDGIGGPGDFYGLAEKMAAAGITMSTVGVGSEPVRPFMQTLADKAKGRAYFCDNGKAIPRIFETDTGVVTKKGITEEPFFPQVVHATQVLRGLDISQAPTLLGYVETQAKPEAHVVLAAKTGEPILALWRCGRGATAAFTSDIQSRWAAPWLNWSGFGRFWVQLVRATMRHDRPQTFAAFRRCGGRAALCDARCRGPRRTLHQRRRRKSDGSRQRRQTGGASHDASRARPLRGFAAGRAGDLLAQCRSPSRRQASRYDPRGQSRARDAADGFQCGRHGGDDRKAGSADRSPLAVAAGGRGDPACARSGGAADGESPVRQTGPTLATSRLPPGRPSRSQWRLAPLHNPDRCSPSCRACRDSPGG